MTTPRPKWFVTRGPGVYTALIPVDELPYSVNLQGVPRTMTVDQVVGMTLVAETGPPQHRHLLDRQSPFPGQTLIESAPKAPVTPPSKFFAPDAHVSSNGNLSQQTPTPASSGVTKLVEKPSTVPTSTPEPKDGPKPGAMVRVDSFYPRQRPLPPSGQEPDETKKVYCSYWMHHGSCDYTQQGCKYKHEMPTDRNVLLSLGFRAVPKWYVEEQMARKAHSRNQETPVARSVFSSAKASGRGKVGEAGERPLSAAGKDKASAREEPNVKRSRFVANSTPTGPQKQVTTVGKQPPTAPKLHVLAQKQNVSTPKPFATKPPTTAAGAPSAPGGKIAAAAKEPANLIDLSDTEDTPSPSSTATKPTSASKSALPSTALPASTPPHSPSLCLSHTLTSSPTSRCASTSVSASESASDTDTPSSPKIQSAPTPVLHLHSSDTAPSTGAVSPSREKEKGKGKEKAQEKAVFVPPGESLTIQRERRAYQRQLLQQQRMTSARARAGHFHVHGRVPSRVPSMRGMSTSTSGSGSDKGKGRKDTGAATPTRAASVAAVVIAPAARNAAAIAPAASTNSATVATGAPVGKPQVDAAQVGGTQAQVNAGSVATGLNSSIHAITSSAQKGGIEKA